MSEILGDKKIAVITDIHEEYDSLARVIDYYSDLPEEVKPDVIVAAGDTVTGNNGNLAKTLDLVNDAGIVLLKGNQEYNMLAGFYAKNSEALENIRYSTKPFGLGQLQSVARSYGLGRELKKAPKSELISGIMEAMHERGHLEMLARAAMYYEGRNFVAIHAGLTNEGWLLQKQKLFYANDALLKGQNFDPPPQLFDFKLAKQRYDFSGTHKLVVTGHDHHTLRPRTLGRNRVLLGSDVPNGQPLYSWQSWDYRIKEHK